MTEESHDAKSLPEDFNKKLQLKDQGVKTGEKEEVTTSSIQDFHLDIRNQNLGKASKSLEKINLLNSNKLADLSDPKQITKNIDIQNSKSTYNQQSVTKQIPTKGTQHAAQISNPESQLANSFPSRIVFKGDYEGEERKKLRWKHIKNNLGLIVISLILIISSIYLIYYFYKILKHKNNQAVVRSTPGQIITTEEHRVIKLGPNDSLIASLNQIKNSISIDQGTSIEIIFTRSQIINKKEIDTPVTSNDFMNELNAHVPSSFLRTLKPEFTFGYESNNGLKPFLILKTVSYDNAYSAMLDWEKSLQSDFNQVTLNTSTTTLTMPLHYKDSILLNKDIRVLKDIKGNSLIMYSFIDQETIIISTDQNVLKDLFLRINALKIVQ